MSKFSIWFSVLLLAGYANAQDLCTIAAAQFPSAVQCTGTGSKVTLTVSAQVPYGVTYTLLLPTGLSYTTLTLAASESPCKPATATAVVADSKKMLITSGKQTIFLTNGVNVFPISDFTFPIIGAISIQLEVTLTGGIDSTAGLTFAGLLRRHPNQMQRQSSWYGSSSTISCCTAPCYNDSKFYHSHRFVRAG